jgi:Family of unknown function (DUF5317)
MLMIAVVGLGLISVPLFGGRLSALADVRLRQAWTMPAALAVQIVITTVLPEGAGMLHPVAHVASYLLGAVFLVANWQLPRMWLVAAGATLNLLVIGANGGVMPADPDALRRAGLHADASEFQNSTAVEDARLAWLGDIFAWPVPLPLANVFSVGDVCLVVGGILLLHGLCRPRGEPRAGAEAPLDEDDTEGFDRLAAGTAKNEQKVLGTGPQS